MSTLKRVLLIILVAVVMGSGSPPVRGATGTPHGDILPGEVELSFRLN